MNNIKTVNVYGDSVLKGVIYDDEKGRYVTAKGDAVSSIGDHFGIKINNYSKFGATINEGIKLVKHDIERGYKCDVAVLEFGGNDSDFDWAAVVRDPGANHLSKTPPAEYERKLKELVMLLRSQGVEVVLSTLPPVDGRKYFNYLVSKGYDGEKLLEYLHTPDTITRYQEIYSCINASVAAETGCKLCDVRTAFLIRKNVKDLTCTDGIHPSVRGQLIIADRFYRFIHKEYPKLKPKSDKGVTA